MPWPELSADAARNKCDCVTFVCSCPSLFWKPVSAPCTCFTLLSRGSQAQGRSARTRAGSRPQLKRENFTRAQLDANLLGGRAASRSVERSVAQRHCCSRPAAVNRSITNRGQNKPKHCLPSGSGLSPFNRQTHERKGTTLEPMPSKLLNGCGAMWVLDRLYV